VLWLCFLDEPPSQSFQLLGGGGIQARLPTYKKVCVNLARERMIVDLSTGFLVWLLVRPRSTRRVTLGAPCSKPAVHLHLHLLVTPAALHFLLPAQARNHSLITAQRHTRVPVCLYAFGARPLTAFVCAGRSLWNMIQLTRTSAR